MNESKPRGQGPIDTARGFGPGGDSAFNAVRRSEVKLYLGNLLGPKLSRYDIEWNPLREPVRI